MIDEDIEDINWRTEVSQNRQIWQSPKHVDVASRNCSPRTYSTYSLISLEIWTVKVGSVYWCLVTGATQWNSWGNISVEELLSFIERGSATFFSTAPTKENRMTANAHQCPSMQFNYCKTPSPQERVWLVTLNICIHLYCVCVSVCPCVHVFHGVQSDPGILPGWWHQGGLEAKKIQEDPRRSKKYLLTDLTDRIDQVSRTLTETDWASLESDCQEVPKSRDSDRDDDDDTDASEKKAQRKEKTGILLILILSHTIKFSQLLLGIQDVSK